MSDEEQIEDLLAQVVAGERPLEDDEVRALLADPVRRAQLTELRRAAEALDVAAQADRDMLASLRAAPVDAADREFVRGTLARAGMGSPTRRFPLRRAAGVVLAASLLLTAAILFGRGPDSPTPEEDPAPILLNAERLELLGPTETGASFDEFRWRPLGEAEGVTYRLVVEGPGGELWRAKDLQAPLYRPNGEERARMEGLNTITWRVFLFAEGSTSPIAWQSRRSSR